MVHQVQLVLLVHAGPAGPAGPDGSRGATGANSATGSAGNNRWCNAEGITNSESPTATPSNATPDDTNNCVQPPSALELANTSTLPETNNAGMITGVVITSLVVSIGGYLYYKRRKQMN